MDGRQKHCNPRSVVRFYTKIKYGHVIKLNHVIQFLRQIWQISHRDNHTLLHKIHTLTCFDKNPY